LERFSTRLAGEYDPKAISAFFFEHLADFQSDFDGFSLIYWRIVALQ
jgi:hypothetical protein